MNIFQKQRLRPTQLRTVAGRRFGDADALRRTRKNARANGAMYLGGFVIECLLKAKLLEKRRWLQAARSPVGLSKDDAHLWSLCYRWHDLDAILARLPEVSERLLRGEQRGSNRLLQSLKSICAGWTVYARYSPRSADIDDAESFLDQIKELMPWLE